MAIPDLRGDPQQGPANWFEWLLAGLRIKEPLSTSARLINHLERPREIALNDDRAARDFLRLLNDEHLKRHSGDTELSARIAAYELAGRMQQIGTRGRRPVARKSGHACPLRAR